MAGKSLGVDQGLHAASSYLETRDSKKRQQWDSSKRWRTICEVLLGGPSFPNRNLKPCGARLTFRLVACRPRPGQYDKMTDYWKSTQVRSLLDLHNMFLVPFFVSPLFSPPVIAYPAIYPCE